MKTAIITGASGALGKVITERFLQEKWRVYGLCKHADSAKALASEMSKYGTLFHAAVCDVASAASTQNFFKSAPLKSCQALIHTAGGIRAGKSIAETDMETVHLMMEMNYYTAVTMIHACLPLMQAEGGLILTIGAKSALLPEKNKAAYSASKAALVSLTQATALEGKTSGIRANCIVPSVIDTAANREWGSAEDVAKWVRPETIAETVLMLANQGSDGISGAVIPMYGKM